MNNFVMLDYIRVELVTLTLTILIIRAFVCTLLLDKLHMYPNILELGLT